MGCCSSTTNKSTTEKSQFPNISKLHNNRRRRTDPFPVPLPEEESVKQVLSETPIIPKAFRKSNELRRIPYSFPKNLSNPDGIYHKHSIFKNPQDLSEDVSEVQSDCLSSASFLTEENYSDVRRVSPVKMRDRSVSGDFNKGVAVEKSPRPKSNTSPNRVRSRRDGFRPNTRKRDSGESSGCRSISPVMRGSPVEGWKKGLGRSVSADRNGMSLDRVKPELGGMKIDDLNQSHRENQWPPTRNESLENPLVSLECFIFL